MTLREANNLWSESIVWMKHELTKQNNNYEWWLYKHRHAVKIIGLYGPVPFSALQSLHYSVFLISS